MNRARGDVGSVCLAAAAMGLMAAMALIGAYAMDGLDPTGFGVGMAGLTVIELAVIGCQACRARRRGDSPAEALHAELHKLIVAAVFSAVVLFIAAVIRPAALALCLSAIAGAAGTSLVIVLCLGVGTHVVLRLAPQGQ
jgi:hypothetical protein